MLDLSSSQVESAKSRGDDTALKSTCLYCTGIKVIESLQLQFIFFSPAMQQLKHSHGHFHVSSAPSLGRHTTLSSPGEEQRLNGRKSKMRVCPSKEAGWITRRTRKALGAGAIGVQERGKWENAPSVVVCLCSKCCL